MKPSSSEPHPCESAGGGAERGGVKGEKEKVDDGLLEDGGVLREGMPTPAGNSVSGACEVLFFLEKGHIRSPGGGGETAGDVIGNISVEKLE